MHNENFGVGDLFSDAALKQLEQYYDLLMEWNQKINLTSLTDREEVFIKHFYDSAQICHLPEWRSIIQGHASVVDIGTGAGFPGVPLAILYPDVMFTLCDALAKRLKFIDTVIQELGLQNIELVHSRAEDLGQNKLYRHRFDACLSRAVAKLNILLEFMCPLVKVGGVSFAYKGPTVSEEISEGIRCGDIVGGKVLEAHKMSLPHGYGERTIVTVQQVKETPRKYPRKAGVPQKSPL